MNHEYRHALEAARFYRLIGLVPLPGRMDVKRPALWEYKQYRQQEVPTTVYSEDQWRTTNVQLLTGAQSSGATKIIVIDLDSKPAVVAWQRLCERHAHRVTEGTWMARTGSGGQHIYYRLDPDVVACPTRLLWGLYDPQGGQAGTGGWVKHTEVKLLGEGSLVVAPPSRHVVSGKEYHWLGRCSPGVYALPALAPAWLLALPGLRAPALESDPDLPTTPMCPRGRQRLRPDADRDAVLQALGSTEKLRLATSWGLRPASGSRPTQVWVGCHALDREDSTPSAAFCPETGVYLDFGGSQRRLSFWDLAVALGAYRSWGEALDAVRAYALPG